MQTTWIAGAPRAGSSRQCHVSQRAPPPSVRASRVARVASGHTSSENSSTGTQAVLDRYQALLREYRLHKHGLGDWFATVASQQQRPPQLLDAQATGDETLVTRFQQYLMVRKRLLAEIPLLRDQLQEALQQDTLHHHSSSSSSSSTAKSSSKQRKHKTGVNANQATPLTKTQAVGQFFAAVNYRKHQKASHTDQASAAATALSHADGDVLPEYVQATAALALLAAQHAAAAQAMSTADQQQGTVAAAAAVAHVAPVSSSHERQVATDNPSQQQQHLSQQVTNREQAASHILDAAVGSSGSTAATAPAASGRAAAAALAALAYKKQKQVGTGPGASAGDADPPRYQRPLAIQMAPPPLPPAGYRAAQPAATADAAHVPQPVEAVTPMVETGKMDVVYAQAARRGLDSELSLEATLQGVPGGIGSDLSSQLFAAPRVLQGGPASEQPHAAGVAHSDGGTAADSAAPKQQQQQQQQQGPVGQVVTARFDVYSGRRRVMDSGSKLDDFLAGLSEAYSSSQAAGPTSQPPPAVAAAAAGVVDPSVGTSESSNSSTTAAGLSVSDKSSSQKQQPQQQWPSQRPNFASGGDDADSGSGPLLPPEVVPLPT